MSECTHDCQSCQANCSSHPKEQTANNDMLAPENAASHVRRVIGVVSGKGGVGKLSLIHI